MGKAGAATRIAPDVTSTDLGQALGRHLYGATPDGRFLFGSAPGEFASLPGEVVRFDGSNEFAVAAVEAALLPEDTSIAGTRLVGEDDSRPSSLLDARCAALTDVRLDHPFSDDIDAMAVAGVIGGYADQTFKPAATVTRQAMAAFLYRLAAAERPAPTTAPFDDVSTSHPYFTEIAWAADEGITTGYPDDTFRPGATVTRQATAAFLHRTQALLDS
jgi:hypothetical protein